MQAPPATYLVDGAAIRARRKSAGLLTGELAAIAGISRSYLTQLELGIKRHMRPPTYTALRTALGIHANDPQLLANTGDPTHQKE